MRGEVGQVSGGRLSLSSGFGGRSPDSTTTAGRARQLPAGRRIFVQNTTYVQCVHKQLNFSKCYCTKIHVYLTGNFEYKKENKLV